MLYRFVYCIIVAVLFGKACKADFVATSIVPISCQAFYTPETIYLGALDCKKDKTLALSALSRFSHKVIGLTPEKVVYKNNSNADNPLYGASIFSIGLLSGRVVAVKKDELTTLYATTATSNNTQVTATILPDELPVTNLLSTSSGLVVVSARKPNELSLGVVFLDLVESEKISAKKTEESEIQREWQWRHERNDAGKAEIATIVLNLDSSQLSSGNSLTALGHITDFYYDGKLNRFYGCFQVTSGATETSGAKAVILGSVVGNRLLIQSIAPDAVFDSTSIVGTRGAQEQVLLSKVRTMHTTTGHAYLLAVRTIENKQSVYAMPLVGVSDDTEIIGTLADKQSSNFIKPATFPGHTVALSDVEAQVGGTAILPGNITQLQVVNDAVYVAVAGNAKDQAAGIFSSQAIFDAMGTIVAWTQWRRAGGVAESVQSFVYDPDYTFFWYMPAQTDDAKTEYYIKRTRWSSEGHTIQKLIPKSWLSAGGVQSVHSFDRNTHSFNKQHGHRIALVAVGGARRLLLVQTGMDKDGVFMPVSSDNPAQILSDGSLRSFSGSAQALEISGGDLAKVGYIASVEIISDGSNGWLLVGGTSGLAILARPDGSGWPVTPGLGNNFSGLTSDMAFKFLGRSRGIRKIVARDNRVYVLSYDKLERIHVNAQDFATGTISAVALCKSNQNRVPYLSDMVIAEPYAFLATSAGLLKSSSTSSIATAEHDSAINWQTIELPYSAGWKQHRGPVTRLFAIEAAHKSMIYVLNGYVHGEQARLYRIAFDVTTGEAHLLPDYMYQNGERGFFASVGDYRTHIVTDGSAILATRGAQADDGALLEIWPSSLKAGTSFAGKDTKRIVLKEGTRTIGRLLYDTTLGTWLIPGEFGIMLHG